MIDRRTFISVVPIGLMTALRALAQPAPRVYRVGILRPTAPAAEIGIPLALRELGYVEGQNLAVDIRYADGKLDTLPALARDLAQRRVDVIIAAGAPAMRAANAATSTIPIVISGNFDPVAAGLAGRRSSRLPPSIACRRCTSGPNRWKTAA